MPRLQAPTIDVPVPAGSPAAATATTILVAPPASGTAGGWGSPGPAAASAGTARPAPAPPPPIVIPAIPPHPGPFRIQQRRSLSEMANEQLRRGTKPRDPLAEGMGEAAVDDCLHAPDRTPMMGGLLAAPGLAARALSGRCAK